MEAIVRAISQAYYMYIFYFFTCKNYSLGIAMLATKTLLSETFLAIFAFSITKIVI